MAMFGVFLFQATALRADEPQTIDLTTLPEPPNRIAESIEQWKVKLTTGQRPPDHPANVGGLDADTNFQISFRYRCRSKWQPDSQSGTVRIQVSFSRIDWNPSHTIWLRHPPAAESFWDDPLVLHEFDHVRISGDPRMEKLFRKKLRDQPVITVPIKSDQVVDQAFIDRLVDQHVSEVFQKIQGLIGVRYRELDRVTANGRRKIPEDSIIHQWLGQEIRR